MPISVMQTPDAGYVADEGGNKRRNKIHNRVHMGGGDVD